MTPVGVLIVTAIVGLALGAIAAMIVSEFRKGGDHQQDEETRRAGECANTHRL